MSASNKKQSLTDAHLYKYYSKHYHLFVNLCVFAIFQYRPKQLTEFQ